MQNVSETKLIESSGFILRIRPPENTAHPRILLMLHGLSGNEDVMWVFARRLPRTYWVIAPRAVYQAKDGGYSWLSDAKGLDTPIENFLPSVERLIKLIDAISLSPEPDRTRIDIMGFSQGAALTLAYTVSHPERVRKVGCLAGFLPLGGDKYLKSPAIKEIPFFVAHGSQDPQVPVERARETVRLLKTTGARITYCEDEVGHRLSVNCFKSLESFFSDSVLTSPD